MQIVKVLGLTDSFKGGSVELFSVHGVLINLPVTRVHNVAVLTSQDHATAVWDGMCHSDGLAPANINHAAWPLNVFQHCRQLAR